MKPLVKICGVTRPEDARLAVRLGATHIGCVMVPASPRCASADQADSVFQAVGESARRVLVFKRQTPSTILEVARRIGTTNVQLYETQEEDASLLENEGMTVYRVRRMDADARELPALAPAPTVERPMMLDVEGGGTGRAFRWEVLGAQAPHAVFIAGGIRADNVDALLAHRPYGLDLSSGVESRPGIKDHARMSAFFEALERSL